MFMPKSPVLRQYVIIITANLSVLSLGFGQGWVSPVLVKLRNDTDVVLSRPVTEYEGSWIVSSLFLTTIVLIYPAAYLTDSIGRKYTILVGWIPQLISCFLFTFATDIWMVILGRVLCGASMSFIYTVVPTYAAEIASKETRGALGTLFQIICSFGAFVVLAIGPFTSYDTVNIVYTTMSLAFTVPLVLLPDSPYMLYTKGKFDESKKVLTFIRGTEDLAAQEIEEYSKTKCDVKINKLHLFKNTTFLKTLAVILILGIGGQMSGFSTAQVYLQTILETTNTNVKPEIASAVIGFIQFLAGSGTSRITDRFGRKPILIWTYSGMAVGMIGLGIFFKLKDIHYEISGILNYLPMISLILVLVGYSAGHGSIYFTLIAELFEGPARSIGVSLGLQITSICIFITSKYFVEIIAKIGPAITYWIFAADSLLTCMFVVFFIPETKGKAFSEIQEALGATKVLSSKPTIVERNK